MKKFKVTYITYSDKTITKEVAAPNKYALYGRIANCREIVSESEIKEPTTTTTLSTSSS